MFLVRLVSTTPGEIIFDIRVIAALGFALRPGGARLRGFGFGAAAL
eukprot:COSAG01_NODE_54181_length_333_cov_30.679487_1_plen_45_part_10